MGAPISRTADRDHLVRALTADLVGPFRPEGDEGPTDEVLRLPPSRWYLTGFLAPQEDREVNDPTAEEELGVGSDEEEEESDAQEPEPKQRHRFPASMGMSVLLPATKGTGDDSIRVTVRFAEYMPVPEEVPDKRRPRTFWRRVVRAPQTVEIALNAEAVAKGARLPDTAGIWVVGKIERAEAPGLPEGTRALSLFVVNRRAPGEERGKQDAEFIFQVELEIQYAAGFQSRPNLQGEDSADWDDRVADLQFRDRCEWAVGHGVSVEVVDKSATGKVTRVRTTWVPTAEVRRVITRDEPGVVIDMEALATLADGDAVRRALAGLVEGYGRWLGEQTAAPIEGARRRKTREELVRRAEQARERIRRGIERLAVDAEILTAFRLANEAMALAARQRSPERYEKGEKPSWRLFQLAFLLLNIESIADDVHADRETVELIFFPTGGGKTEAYLGVIAFTLLLRRLRGQTRPDKGLGVAVLLRYTLRLLTLDQLSRAATLMCALERLRQRDPASLGHERLTVGLWVGRSATANTIKEVKRKITEYKNSTSKNAPSPFPLTNCPWCRGALGPNSLTLMPNPARAEWVLATCMDYQCEFSARKNAEGLPVLFVDEQIYEELPAFIVATVDKFAMLPWRGETGMLFGRANAHDGRRFYGPMDTAPKGATTLPAGLHPPELIVQDELHLISGPLGTMVGLYETAIEELCTRVGSGEAPIRPKILASTATVRRARQQIQALFARRDTALFPPPGIDESETWFAGIDREKPGRLYVGVAAQGRSMKGILLRVYATSASAAQKRYDAKAAPEQDADAYMTLVGYFNSLRELGGMRRLVEDEVRTRAAKSTERRPANHAGVHPWFADREVQHLPVELTSREPTAKIKEAKDRMAKRHLDPEHVDVVLASNMISVGVDIDRLGLMVVAGQPKTTSEYIQSSSRVGRQYPGLVVTCFNVARPRDRSHYERFVAYHDSFYRFVEATSLTPFSGRALERGLAGTLVAMTRLVESGMTPPSAAMDISRYRAVANRMVEALAARAARHGALDARDHDRLRDVLRKRGAHLLDAWEMIVTTARDEGAARRSYSRFDQERKAGKPLLHMVIDDDRPAEHSDEALFVAPTSMRDVEASVHLWIQRGALGGRR